MSEWVAFAQNWGILQTRIGKRWGVIDYFQIQKWMLQTNRVEIVDEENGVICIASMFVSCVMVLKLSKKVHFFQIWADLKTIWS